MSEQNLDYGTIFLYCLYAVFQMYILMAPGVFAFYRKMFTSKTVAMVSELLFVFMIPIYGTIEISRIATIEILNYSWILFSNFIICLIVSYIISFFIHKIFRLDERIRESFHLMNTIPGMGALPLVIGKAFCFPGGPIEGDSFCESIVGLMMLCYFIMCISVFLIGYLFILSDKARSISIEEKWVYLWHCMINKVFKKDETILYLFTKYLKNQTKARAWFDAFEKEHREDMLQLKYEKSQKQHHQKSGKEHAEGEVQIETVKGMEDEDDDGDKDSYFDQSSISEASENAENDVDFNPTTNGHNMNTKRSQTVKNVGRHDKHEFVMVLERKESFYPEQHLKTKFDNEVHKIQREVVFNKSGKHFKVDIDFEVPVGDHSPVRKRANTFKLKNKNFQLQTSQKFQKDKIKLNNEETNINMDNHNHNQNQNQNQLNEVEEDKGEKVNTLQKVCDFLENPKNQSEVNNMILDRNDYDVVINWQIVDKNEGCLITANGSENKDEGKVGMIQAEELANKKVNDEKYKEKKEVYVNGPTVKQGGNRSNREIIWNYYQSAFDIIEEDPDNFNLPLIKEYESIKTQILSHVVHNPPKFPIVRSVKIDSSVVDVLNKEWEQFEPKWKIMSSSFKGLTSTQFDIGVLLSKCIAPPTVSVLIGWILSISDNRTYLFNKKSHYFVNLLDGIDVVVKAMVPYLFALLGLSSASTGGLSMNVPLKKLHIVIVFIMRFIVVPAFGILAIHIWSAYYGGIVKESFGFRIMLFFPWCLPSAPNMAVVVNLTKYFFEEYGYLIWLQNVSCVVTLTLLYMIYFIAVGW